MGDGSAIIHLPRLIVPFLVLAFALAGCTEKEYVYVENTTRVAELQANITQLEQQLNACETNPPPECPSCPVCEACPAQNCSQGPSCATNTSRYSFTCADIYSGYYFLTKYKCFWDTKQRYGFGQYYDVSSGCITLGLPDVCTCMDTIPELVGTRLSTGFGINWSTIK